MGSVNDERRCKVEAGYVLMSFDVMEIRKDFPFFKKNSNLIYFDNAATTHKPQCVLDAINNYYSTFNSNVHRGVYKLAEEATNQFECTRECVADFINSKNRDSIIFTSGTTESINLVAHGWAKNHLSKGDHILLSEMEHHSNIVPWQMIAKELNLIIDYIPINKNGELNILNLENLFSNKTKLVSITHQSNVLGTVNPIKRIIDYAHSNGSVVVVDGAQSTAHQAINVDELDCDFFVFSGHKIFGPTGVGVLYGKMERLEEMSAIMGGGEMIDKVSKDNFTLNKIPWRFEAGTPPIAQVISLKSAIDYLKKIGLENISSYENELIDNAQRRLLEIKGIELYSPMKNKGPTLTFNIKDVHSYDYTKLLDQMGVAIRSGHHCAQPLLDSLNISSSSRLSLSFYNTIEEVDIFFESTEKVLDILL